MLRGLSDHAAPRQYLGQMQRGGLVRCIDRITASRTMTVVSSLKKEAVDVSDA